jgi:hypothetical protein
MDSCTLTRQPPLTDRALVEQLATVDGAGCDKTQIPYSPPDGALLQATGANPWAVVIEIIVADKLAIK